MILGVTKLDWLERLAAREADDYLTLVDSIVVVTDKPMDNEPPYYYIQGDYNDVLDFIKGLACCKAYPQKTLFTVNYSVVELTDGMTPATLRKEWLDELRVCNLVR